MAGRIIYVTDAEFEILCSYLNMPCDIDSIDLNRKIIFMRDKEKEKEIPKIKHVMTRAEAIECLAKHAPFTNPEKIIDFYIEAGMLEIKKEEVSGIPGFLPYSEYIKYGELINELDKRGFKIIKA